MVNDPLEALFVTPEHVAGEQRNTLVRLISPFLTIVGETGDVQFGERGDNLKAKQKILVFLLARLALAARNGSNFAAAVTPKQVSESTGIPGGTVRPHLMSLVREHKILANKKGEYYISAQMLGKAEEELGNELT